MHKNRLLLFLLFGDFFLLLAHADDAHSITAQFITTWSKEGETPGDFNFPIGIAINSKGALVVVDSYNHRVQKFEIIGK